MLNEKFKKQVLNLNFEDLNELDMFVFNEFLKRIDEGKH